MGEPLNPKRAVLHGFALGGYLNRCRDCGKSFQGDKRAIQCLDCAVKKATAAARAEGYRTGIEDAAKVAPDKRHFEILAEAMAEVKATNDGLSDQSISAIVDGCIAEINALPVRIAEGSADDVLAEPQGAPDA